MNGEDDKEEEEAVRMNCNDEKLCMVSLNKSHQRNKKTRSIWIFSFLQYDYVPLEAKQNHPSNTACHS